MKYEFSAGGVVYKIVDSKIEILVAQHSFHKGWVFPKGLIGDTNKDESKEQTALREVLEETGIIGEIQKELPAISYFYSFEKEKRKKTVYYYIMQERGGDITTHDLEMQVVEWIPFDAVYDRLTYPSDKKVWESAKKSIEELAQI